MTLLRADAHGVVDSLEDAGLVLRQCLREAHRRGIFEALEQPGLLFLAVELPQSQSQKHARQGDQDQGKRE